MAPHSDAQASRAIVRHGIEAQAPAQKLRVEYVQQDQVQAEHGHTDPQGIARTQVADAVGAVE